MSYPEIHKVESDVFDPAGGDRMTVFGRFDGATQEVRVGITEATIVSEPMAGTPDLDGVNDRLMGSAISNYMTAAAYSGWVLFWADAVDTDGVAGESNDALLSSAGGGYWSVYLRSSGLVGMHHYDTAQQRVTASATILGAWNLVQFRWDGTNLNLRVNNGAWSTTAAANLGDLSAALRMGVEYTGTTHFFDGRCAEVALSQVALSDADFDNVTAYINKRYGLSLGGILPSTFDPATLALSGWWRSGSYVSGTWTGTASAGSSGSRNLTEATNYPAVATSSILLCTAPAKPTGTYALTVKNASGRTSFYPGVQYANPGTISNCIWWLRPDDSDVDVDVPNGEVTLWRDKSGIGDSNRNVAPPTADNPAWNASDADYGGKPTVGPFNRVGNFRLASGTFATTYPTFTMGIVGHTDQPDRYSLDQVAPNRSAFVASSSAAVVAYGGNAASTITNTAAYMTKKRGVVMGCWNGASSWLHGDGTTVTGSQNATTLGAGAMSVGCYSGGTSGTYGAEKIAEVYAYSRALTLREVRDLRKYRDSYYGQIA